MQPESSMENHQPRRISIQKLKEACELVSITKQRRHIFLNETYISYIYSFMRKRIYDKFTVPVTMLVYNDFLL